MLAPGNYVQWKFRIKRYIDTKPNRELFYYCLENPPYELGWKDKRVPDSDGNLTTSTERVFETYKNVTQDVRDQLNAEAEAVQIILTEIDNDIYSTVDACPNACEMWKAIKRLKQGESINVQDLETNLNAGYESQRSGNVVGAREIVGSSMVQKSGIQCYNCKEFGHVSRECLKPKRNKLIGKMILNDESDDQELEAHYMYMAKVQEVSPDAVDSGPIFDTEPEQKVQNDDHYDVFAIECQHPEQSESVHETYLIEQDAHNVLIKSVDMNSDSKQIDQNDEDADLAKELDMNSDSKQIDQNDEDADLAKESELLTSLIEKLKCEIDESKNHNKFLETSNKVLIDNLKSEIKDFKNKNNSLELSNNQFKEANNKLSAENDLLYSDFKKSQAELKRRDSIEYASKMEFECAK
nr:hypothetical protein [Tanacetum cinerariifolium]